MQVCPRNKSKSAGFQNSTASLTDRIYRGLKCSFYPILDSCSIDKLSIEIYKNQIFSSDFIPICVYMFRFSFLTTLNIYKDYFKSRRRWRECEAKFCSCKLWPKTKFALLHLWSRLCRQAWLCACKVLHAYAWTSPETLVLFFFLFSVFTCILLFRLFSMFLCF